MRELNTSYLTYTFVAETGGKKLDKNTKVGNKDAADGGNKARESKRTMRENQHQRT